MPVAAPTKTEKRRPTPADSDTDAGPAWRTILFNCDCHSFEDVEEQLMKATKCGLAKARNYAWEVHSKGSAIVFSGAKARCEAVADVLGAIGLVVKVSE